MYVTWSKCALPNVYLHVHVVRFKLVPVDRCMQQHELHAPFPSSPHFSDKMSCQKEVEWRGRATYELRHKLTTTRVCLDSSEAEERKRWVGGREGAKRIGGKIKGETNSIHFTSVCTYTKHCKILTCKYTYIILYYTCTEDTPQCACMHTACTFTTNLNLLL